MLADFLYLETQGIMQFPNSRMSHKDPQYFRVLLCQLKSVFNVKSPNQETKK